MDLSRPHTALTRTLDGEVLVALARTTRPLTGREVARLVARGSHEGVRRVLQRLVDHGLVGAQEAGPALLYTLNRKHLAAPAADVLAGMHAELFSRIRGALEAWHVLPIHVSLFGSVARGDGDTSSDIDVFIVRPEDVDENDSGWRDQIDRLATDIRDWTGNRAGISEVSRRDLRRLRRERPPIVSELTAHAVTLFGPSVPDLMGQ